MIIMLPNTSTQTISILPRKNNFYLADEFLSRISYDNGLLESESCLDIVFSIYNQVDIYIRQDGTGESDIIEDIIVVDNVNYIDLTFASAILKEGETYSFQVTSNGSLLHRGKIFATNQTDFTVKHVQSQSNYTQYNDDSETTYTVI